MREVPHFPKPGQVISHLFDFPNRKKYVWIEWNRKLIRAPKSDFIIDPYECFNFSSKVDLTSGKQNLAILETDAINLYTSRIEINDRLYSLLPLLDLETLQLYFITAPLNSHTPNDILELKGVYITYEIWSEMIGGVVGGVLIIKPEDGTDKNYMEKRIVHRQPAPASEPGQKPKPKTYPPLRVVSDPETFKPDRRKKKKAPPDVLKYISRLAPKSKWRTALKTLYNQSWYGDIIKNKYYQGKNSHIGRYYTLGIDRLVNVSGQSEITIKRNLALMLKHNIIRRWKGGYPGQGNSIYELPLNMSHVMSWIRKHKTQVRRKEKPKTGR